MKQRLLIVDDDAEVVAWLAESLTEAGYAVEGVTSPREALARVERTAFDLVVTDVYMPELRGTDLMREIHARRPGQLVLLVTAFGSIDMAVEAVRAGAADLVTKPFSLERLKLAIERAIEERQMRREIVHLRRALPVTAEGTLVARSPAMQKAVELARRVARAGLAVLITGESGVGKGAMARFVHESSDRASGPFVPVNCAALPGPLVESELFGVRRGAFTDAREDRAGLFTRARGGTLFLDEIAEMPLETQPKLLHALETGRVRPVGATDEVETDVRVVAATNRPLEEALRDKTFRSDLYFRLNIVRIEVPPLRERPEDVEALVDVFLAKACARQGRPLMGIAAEARRWLLRHDWPGNVRELANVVERAVALADHDTIVLDDLQLAGGSAPSGDFLGEAVARGMTLADVERAYIDRVLQATGGNKVQAAELLDIDRRTLYRRLGGDDA
jgi:DNA-binding NtrC family response regulator